MKQLSKFYLLFTLAIAASAQAQTQFQTIAELSAVSWFDNIVGIENSGVINGPEYKIELMGASTHPFFGSGESKGVVRYNQETFYVPLLYDIFKDELVVKHLSGSGRGWYIQLDKKRVSEFVLSERLFRNFNGSYHEVVFERDDFLLVSKRFKNTQVVKGVLNYLSHDRFFLIVSNDWMILRGLSGFMNVLTNKEDKKRLKQFVKENKINVRKFRNEDLAKVGEFVYALRDKKQ